MIVLDASAVLDLLLDLPPHAHAIRRRIREEAPGLLAPHLLDAEVGQVLRRYTRLRELTAARAGGRSKIAGNCLCSGTRTDRSSTARSSFART